MTDEKIFKKIAFDGDKVLNDAFQAARDAGKKYKDEKYSNRLAWEIGVKFLLGMGEGDDEEILKQKKEELRLRRQLLDSEEKAFNESWKRHEKKEAQREQETLNESKKIQNLAADLIKYWDKITASGDRTPIKYLIANYPEINKEGVNAVFPATYAPKPTEAEAFKIAACLMGA